MPSKGLCMQAQPAPLRDLYVLSVKIERTGLRGRSEN